MSRRTLGLCALFAVIAMSLMPASTLAGDGDDSAQSELDHYIGLIDGIRVQLTETRDLYLAGDADGAFIAARNAYLDSFELVEIPLRSRDPNLTLEMEDAFARLRNGIKAGDSPQAVTEMVSRLQTGLNDVERILSLDGVAPLVVVGTSFVIASRAGLETILLLSAILAYLAALRAVSYRKAVLAGVGVAGLATVATWFVLDTLIAIAPLRPALVEAIPSVLAVAVTIAFTYWLLQRIDQRRWLEYSSSKVFSAVAVGSTAALFALGFTATFRQGFEAVVSYRALLEYSSGIESWLVLGLVAATGAMMLLSVALWRLGQRVPTRAFLAVAVIATMAVSVAFLGNAVRALQEGYVIGITNLTAYVPRLPIELAQATGFHPTLETIAAQVLLILVDIVLVVFVVRAARRNVAAPATDSAA
jgi:high-affinity iron transporter